VEREADGVIIHNGPVKVHVANSDFEMR
jgi:hypothetical protein